MIYIKSKSEIELIRKAGKVLKDTLDMLSESVREGITTYELDYKAYEYITSQGGKPSFLHYNGFPSSICISIDDEVVHGIPSKTRRLRQGSIVSFDVGVTLNGWQSDAARTVGVGNISNECKQLIKVTEECFFKAIEIIKPSVRLGDVGQAIQRHAEQYGYGVVRELCGHGIGRDLHEDPDVPNYGTAGRGIRLQEGMVIAIEPMINMCTHKVYTTADRWTVRTQDGKPSAHYENTVAITANGADVLTI